MSQDEVVALADTQRSDMLRHISDRILPLQDALELDDISNDELILLRELKSIRVVLSRLDTSKAPDIKWPVLPE
ncbi:tail fiber assembly protein [Hafnia alvei]|uniref:tail fiber assembly protein n=1 Tax=Hafnia alvei TaxID=569 RepID=UPI0014560FB1